MRRSAAYMTDKTHALLVIGSLAIIVFFASIGAAIGGSYALTVSYVHQNQIAVEQAQIKAAKGECESLLALDKARDGFTVQPNAGQSQLALDRLFKGLHGVIVRSQCHALLSGKYKPPGS